METKEDIWRKFLYKNYLLKLKKGEKALDYEAFIEKYNRDNKLGYGY